MPVFSSIANKIVPKPRFVRWIVTEFWLLTRKSVPPDLVIRALNSVRFFGVCALNCARILVVRALDCVQFLLHNPAATLSSGVVLYGASSVPL